MKTRILFVGLVLCLFRVAFGQTELITNGGFEQGPAPWQFAGSGATIVTNGSAHTGSADLQMGGINGVAQDVYQTITFPTNLIAAGLGFYYAIATQDPSGTSHDILTVYITDTSGNVLATVGSASNLNGPIGYTAATFTLASYTGQTNLSSYAGKTVRVLFDVITDSIFGSMTSFNIDDVTMQAATTADIPANDNFANRTALATNTASVTANASNLFATKEPGEPNHAGNSGGHSLWWSWTAPANGVVTINTTGSMFTTLLASYTGSSVTNLTKIASDNGANENNGLAKIKFTALAGTEYEIAVDGFNGDAGSVTLNLAFQIDVKPPTLTISSPAANAKLTNSTVVVQGTAADNIGVALVQYRLENSNGIGDYQNATGTNNWTATVTNLIPGLNTVRARAFDVSSNASLSVARSFTYIIVSPLTILTNGSGTVSPNLNNQLVAVGSTNTVIAKPGPGYVFTNWSIGASSSNPQLTFVMQSNLVLQANFIPNPFIPVAGSYQGLFYDLDPASVVTVSNSGLFTATVTTAGAFTAKLQQGAKSFSVTGQFALDGSANITSIKNAPGMSLMLQLDLAGGNAIGGLVQGNGWNASLTAFLNPKSNGATPPGNYTFVLPPGIPAGPNDPLNSPRGHGYGTLNLSTAGAIKWSGVLGDGTKVGSKCFIAANGESPIYASLYSGQGVLLGWVTFTNDITMSNDFEGILRWTKPPQVTGTKIYTNGFSFASDTNGIVLNGSFWTNQVPLLDWTNGDVVLLDGDFDLLVLNSIELDAFGKVTDTSLTNKLTMTITTKSGLFTGSVTETNGPKTVIKFGGAFLQRRNLGYGQFPGTNQVDTVLVDPEE